ncbi:YdjY domain-containing protein [Verrucomicrobiales bacterium BCK34]|nr:YdjY domain-containing protein [Verrucomicrobiales bacterium BCK34]
MRSMLCLLFFSIICLPLQGEEEKAAPRPGVKKIGENRYRIGLVDFDAKSREISIPVVVNMREGGPIEYVLVHENGKVHEAVLTTAASPLDIQIAMKLLKYKAGNGDVFNKLLPPELIEKEGGKKEDRGDTVFFGFQPDGSSTQIPAYELIIDGEDAEAMEAGGWTYTGSVLEGDTFMAEAEGSILAIYLDHLSLFNMTRDGADLDDRWGARTSAIPEIGTKGIFRISPREIEVTN